MQTSKASSFEMLSSTHPQLTQEHVRQTDIRFYWVKNSDEEKSGAFTQNPAEDIPRNKLTAKLGTQKYVGRMQKREATRVEVHIFAGVPGLRVCASGFYRRLTVFQNYTEKSE